MKYKNSKILITIATHGDEKIGIYVKKKLEKLNVINGQLDFILVNEKAYKRGVRYIDSDLNRVFPGKKNGNYEERLAHSLMPKIREYDLVIDIHSTTSSLRDTVIVVRNNKKVRDLIEVIGPKYAIYMKYSRNHSLISYSKLGVGFEYGKDASVSAINGTYEGICRILRDYGMIESKVKNSKFITKFFRVDNVFKKLEGYKLLNGIKNYEKVKRGDVVAKKGNDVIKAKEDFYPILFGENSYDTYFGFLGKLLNK